MGLEFSFLLVFGDQALPRRSPRGAGESVPGAATPELLSALCPVPHPAVLLPPALSWLGQYFLKLWTVRSCKEFLDLLLLPLLI